MITAEGRWEIDIFGTKGWNINCSSILTQLIQDAGRWCESYASDLFILWKYDIENNLSNPNWEGGEYLFGFREMGVDKKETIKAKQEYHSPDYYRKIRKLVVKIENKKITMELE